MLSFKPTFSLYSFTFIKKLFSSSLPSAIRVVSSPFLRLLIFGGGGSEEQPHVQGAVAAQVQESLESYSTFKIRRGDGEEIPPRPR